jgi:hypothetical protein
MSDPTGSVPKGSKARGRGAGGVILPGAIYYPS